MAIYFGGLNVRHARTIAAIMFVVDILAWLSPPGKTSGGF
jgi:hypothetical protein